MAVILSGVLVLMPLSPYPYLALAGFADGIIPSEKEMRKAEKKTYTRD